MRALPFLLVSALLLAAVAGCADDGDPLPDPPAAVTPWTWSLPFGFPPPHVPEDNPMSVEKVELGRRLFYDTRLSGNETQSCASCHKQELAFTDGLGQAVGSTGEHHPRGAMSLTNAGYYPAFGWANPRLTTLEDQAPVPMFGETPVELGLAGKDEEVIARLKADPDYLDLFAAAFPEEDDPVHFTNIVKSISSFERTLISGSSPWDRYVSDGDREALSPSAQRGARLFFDERFECFHCHGGFNFSDAVVFENAAFIETPFHNNGLYNVGGTGAYPAANPGLFEFTQNPADQGRFKAPSLRNIELTAPYMHDGSLATLEDVIEHYARGGTLTTEGPNAGDGKDSPNKNQQFVRGFEATAQEKEDLINFLKALTDLDFVNNPDYAAP